MQDICAILIIFLAIASVYLTILICDS